MHTLGTHQAAHDALFQHPVSRNLQWREVRAVLERLCDDTIEEHDGHVRFTLHGATLTVHPPRRKTLSDVAEVMRIRHFLERAGAGTAPAQSSGSPTGASCVMDHPVAALKRHDPGIAERVVDAVAIAGGHTSDDQLLAEAGGFFAATPS